MGNKKIAGIVIVIILFLLTCTGIGAAQSYTNQTLWKFDTNGAVYAVTTDFSGTIYTNSEYDCVSTFAINDSTGNLNWKFYTYGTKSSPTYYNDTLYVTGNKVYAFNASTGNLKWLYDVHLTSTPTIYNDILYVAGLEIYAFDALTGSFKWNYSLTSSCTPSANNGSIYIGSEDGNVSALNASTGSLIWDYQTGSKVQSSPEIIENILYVGSQDNFIYALNASTGSLIWKYQTNGAVDSSPAVINGSLYIGSNDEYVYSINSTTGLLNWKYKTYGAVVSSPAVVDDLVFVGSRDAYVYVINATNGDLYWKYRTGSDVISSPVVSNGIVYIGSNDHYLYAIGGDSGVNDTENSYYFGSSRTLHLNQTWELKEGYNLTVVSIDLYGNKALLNLSKNGEFLDEHIVSSGEQYYYNRSIYNTNRIIINCTLGAVFQGQVSSLVVFKNIEQYPDIGTVGTIDSNPTILLKLGQTYDLGNGYSLNMTDVGQGLKCVLSLEKDGTLVDKRIIEHGDLYIYQRKNDSTNSIDNILEIPILKTLYSTSGDYIEFTKSYSLHSDANTSDTEPFTLIKSGMFWDLNEGYSLTVNETSSNTKALVTLVNNNLIVDQYILEENSSYLYNQSNSNDGTIHTIFEINVSRMIHGRYNDYVEFFSNYSYISDVGTVSINNTTLLNMGDTLELNEGFNLTLIEINSNGNEIFINLTKNNSLVNECILSSGDTYYHNMSNDGSYQSIIKFGVVNVFYGDGNKIAIFENIKQRPDIVPIVVSNVTKNIANIRGSIYNGTDISDILTNIIEINSSNFPGFHYSFDNDIDCEILEITNTSGSSIGKTIGKRDLLYTSEIIDVGYAFGDENGGWTSTYQKIGYFGDEYVPINYNYANKLSRLITDDDTAHILKIGQTFELGEGYAIIPQHIDVHGDKVWLELTKNGEYVADKIIDTGNDVDGKTWLYDQEIGGVQDVITLKVFVDEVFQGQTESLCVIKGLWQISDSIVEIKTNETIGLLNVEEVNGPTFTMTNKVLPITLSRGHTIEIANNLSFIVADSNDLRFHISKSYTNYYTYEMRGNVYNISNDGSAVMDYTNFNGFYYDLKNNIGTESLEINYMSGRTIDTNALIYTTEPKAKAFEYASWGSYNIIGFMGEEYFAGYPAGPFGISSAVSLISNGQLSKVLIDESDSRSIYSGSGLILEEGYMLRIDEVDMNGNIVLVTLQKDGFDVISDIVAEGGDFVYKKKLDSTSDVPIIGVNFKNIFRGIETNAVFVDGIFQISDEYTTLKTGDIFGNMKITSINSDEIRMENNNSLFLNQGKTIPIMGAIQFKVLNDPDNVRYYPFVEITIDSPFVDDDTDDQDDFNVAESLLETLYIRGPVFNGGDITNNDLGYVGNTGNGILETNASNFAGFYYDLNTGQGDEKIEILQNLTTSDRTINKNGLVYTTSIMDVDYEQTLWTDKYQKIVYFGEEYVPIKSNAVNKLSKLLIDEDESHTIRTGQSFELEDDYALTVHQIDVNGDKVWLKLTKNGELIDDKVVSTAADGVKTWNYTQDIGGEIDVVTIKIFIDKLFEGQVDNLCLIKGIWQISDSVLEIDGDTTFGVFSVNDKIGSTIKMTNENKTITLNKDTIVEITDAFSFVVADSDDLRFYFFKNYTNPGLYEVRGNIVNLTANVPTTIDYTTFSGLFYDFSNNVGTESFEITSFDGRAIPTESLIYTTIPKKIYFEHIAWGSYNVIGFMGNKYFTGYPAESFFGTSDLILNGQLHKVLVDSNESSLIFSGSGLALQDGFVLNILEIDKSGNKAAVSLSKNGSEIDGISIISFNDTYVYYKDLGSSDNVPTITAHFSDIFREGETEGVSIDGVFQISENYLPINVGNMSGKMQTTIVSSSGIIMKNMYTFSLTKDSNIEIMENIRFKVADDSDNVRFYPFTEVIIQPLTIDSFSPNVSSHGSIAGDSQEFEIATNKMCNIKWLINNVVIQTNVSTVSASYVNKTATAGLYNVTVVAENVNGIVQKVWDWTVTNPTVVEPPSTSSGGGGGGGTSGEDYENIKIKEVVSEQIIINQETSYYFNEESNAIGTIKFTALKNSGTISATIEVLKGRSALVKSDPPGHVYQNMNIWVGKSGFATPDNIVDVKVGFRVEKSWIEENGIVVSTIRLCRHHDDVWNPLPTKQSGEDDKYIYFESNTPGFSPFAITGSTEEEVAAQDSVGGLVSSSAPDGDDVQSSSESTNVGDGEEREDDDRGISAVWLVVIALGLMLIGGMYRRYKVKNNDGKRKV